MLDMPAMNKITKSFTLSKKIHDKMETNNTIIPINILHKYMRSCFESFKRFFTKSLFGTAK
jgi:hypothetical protein